MVQKLNSNSASLLRRLSRKKDSIILLRKRRYLVTVEFGHETQKYAKRPRPILVNMIAEDERSAALNMRLS
jgi:hypothetical protein